MSSLILVCPDCGVKNRIPIEKKDSGPRCGKCGHVFSSFHVSSVIVLTDKNFDQIIMQASLPVLVDFYSPTCGPCKKLAPTLDTLASKFAGKVLLAKIDTSQERVTAAKLQIRAVPTLLFYKDGHVVDQVNGAAPQGEIEAKIQRLF